MIGNGSSGVQLGRALAEQAAHLTAFQRTPHWIVPNKMAQETISPDERRRLREFPYYALWHRFIMFWTGGDLNYPSLVIDRDWPGPGINAENARTRDRLIRYIAEETGGRQDLIEALTPDYPPYVKRMVWDNDWYRTLTRPNVELCTSGIVSADETGVITADGRHHDLDILVFATGFHGTRFLYPMEVRGRSGRTPAEVFGGDDEIRAYLGVAIPDFPNFFRISGPNSSVGHGGSSVFLSEMQAHYIQDCLRYLIERHVAAIQVAAGGQRRIQPEGRRGARGHGLVGQRRQFPVQDRVRADGDQPPVDPAGLLGPEPAHEPGGLRAAARQLTAVRPHAGTAQTSTAGPRVERGPAVTVRGGPGFAVPAAPDAYFTPQAASNCDA